MTRIPEGALVTISNIYGDTTGTLVLNDWQRKWGSSGVHTIRLANGHLFRTEGRLTRAN